MKTLHIKEMENTIGGDGNDVLTAASCAGAVIGVAALAIVAFTTPVGAFTAAVWGSSILGAVGTGLSAGACGIGLSESSES